MLLSLRIAPGGPEEPIFRTVVLKTGGPLRGGFLISLVAHGAVVLLLPMLERLVQSFAYDDVQLQLVAVQSLKVRVAEPLYFTPPPPKAAEAPAPARRSARAAPRLELPPLPKTAVEAPQIVLQPRPLPAIQQDLSNVLAWSPPMPELPRPKPKPFVSPGRSEVPAAAPELLAPPSLDIPNREPALGRINIARSVPVAQPVLPVPPASTRPLRIFQPPPARPQSAAGSAALEALPGDPANLVIVAPGASTPREILAVAPGVMAPRPPAQPPAPPGPTGVGEAARAGSDSQASVAGGRGLASAGATGSVSGGPSTAAGSSGRPSGTKLIAAAPPNTSGVRPPRKVGTFDVVVVQSSHLDSFIDGAGILKGKPVYTVYLPVGRRKPWILQYCLPASANTPPESGDVIRLDLPAPVRPPYPISTALPDAEPQPTVAYTLIHGRLNAAGRFRDLALVGDTQPRMERLLLFLEKWVFQPATKDEIPVEVEMLLAIPPSQI